MSRRRTILAVDDEPDMLTLLRRILEEETDHRVVTEADPVAALDRLRAERFDLLLTDLRMPGLDGIALLDRAREAAPGLPVVVLTAYGTVDTAVEAVRKGALDFVTKPFRRERILVAVEKAMAFSRMAEENRELREELSVREEGDFLGTSPAVRTVVDRADTVAPTTATVLLTGESGTGKEVLARRIHARSGRKGRLVPVNCTAIPETILESELFGHVKGSFTGAVGDKPGLVDEAGGGTLFLDEIGDLPPLLQTKLLRLLQEREYRPVGGLATKTADLRVVAATNHDLDAAVREKRFREDLFYRLNVVRIELPPLRGRMDDIALLAQRFLVRSARRSGREIVGISPAALDAILGHDWPGNVRELQNVIERAVIFCPGDRLRRDDLGLPVRGPDLRPAGVERGMRPLREARALALREFETGYVSALLRECDGNVSRAAEAAGVRRQYFHRLLRATGLDANDFR